MKKIAVRAVDSIDEKMQQIQNRIRLRAYEKYYDRPHDSSGELEDWLAAERELLCVLSPTLKAEENRFVAEIKISDGEPADLEILATAQDVLIYSDLKEAKTDADADRPNPRSAFGVIRFPIAIDPASLRAEFSRGILRLTAPVSQEAKTLKIRKDA